MKNGVKRKKEKVQKLTEEQYAEYIMSLKDESPVSAYKDLAAENHSTPHWKPHGGNEK